MSTNVCKQRHPRPQCLEISKVNSPAPSRMFRKVKRDTAVNLQLSIPASPVSPVSPLSPNNNDCTSPMDVMQQDSPLSFQHVNNSLLSPPTPVWSEVQGGELTPDPHNNTQAPFHSSSNIFGDSEIISRSDTTSNVINENEDSDKRTISTQTSKKDEDSSIIGSQFRLKNVGEVTYAFDEPTNVTYSCKTFSLAKGRELLLPYFILAYDLAFLHLDRVIEDGDQCHALFELPLGGDLHSYIRIKKRLKEDEAKRLIEPIFKLVAECHACNFICRDIKLRKCVFLDAARTQLVYQGLEDGRQILQDDDDVIHDRIGCPAYVSPEVVQSSEGYSGRAADMWGLGVVLYTMLVGRYPFQNSSSRTILQQVRRGEYHLPSWLSLQARCLLRALLCVEPTARISAAETLDHAWFRSRVKTTPRPVPTGFRPPGRNAASGGSSSKQKGKTVAPPDCVVEADWQVPDQSLIAAFSGFL